jgi:hypothetical protein
MKKIHVYMFLHEKIYKLYIHEIILESSYIRKIFLWYLHRNFVEHFNYAEPWNLYEIELISVDHTHMHTVNTHIFSFKLNIPSVLHVWDLLKLGCIQLLFGA